MCWDQHLRTYLLCILSNTVQYRKCHIHIRKKQMYPFLQQKLIKHLHSRDSGPDSWGHRMNPSPVFPLGKGGTHEFWWHSVIFLPDTRFSCERHILSVLSVIIRLMAEIPLDHRFHEESCFILSVLLTSVFLAHYLPHNNGSVNTCWIKKWTNRFCKS